MGELFGDLPEAAWLTVMVTALSFGFGALLACPIAIARSSGKVLLRAPAHALIDIVRGVPPLVWLFIAYFGVGVGAVRMSPIVASIVTLSAVSAVYLAEIYRGGHAAVPRAQAEAAHALGLSRHTTFALVTVPQTLRNAGPAVANYAIGLLKDSSIVATIGVSEIVFVATATARVTADGITPFLVAGATYLVLSLPIAILSRVLDARLRARVAP